MLEYIYKLGVKMSDPKMAALTDHHKLFKNTYWGYSYEPDMGKQMNIIANRNEFAITYQIIKCLPSECYGSHNNRVKDRYPLFDHWEAYKTVNGEAVAIFSTYVNYSNMFEMFKFNKTEKLYSPQSHTYLRVFPDLKSLKMFVKEVTKSTLSNKVGDTEDNSHLSILELLNIDDREYLEKYIVRSGGNHPSLTAISCAFDRVTACEEPGGTLFAMLIKMEEEEEESEDGYIDFKDLIHQQLRSMVCNIHA